jgi:hypothetical protein
LAYEAPADPRWPDHVVAKVHRRGEGWPGHRALEALAAADLGRDGRLRLAAPLAYLAEHDVSLQSYLPQDRSLLELISVAARAELEKPALQTLGEVGSALTHLHTAELTAGDAVTLDQELAAVRRSAARLAKATPQTVGAIEPLLATVTARAASAPDDPAVPSHGAFRPAQVRLHGSTVGIVDVDGFCWSEPAQDVGRFVAKLRLLVRRERGEASVADRHASAFVDAYGLPVSVERVALWELLDLAKALLQAWTRGRPDQAPVLVDLLADRIRALS